MEEYVTEEILLAKFVKGLDPLIKGELRLHNPKTSEQAMEWAQHVEDKHKGVVGPKPNATQKPYSPFTNYFSKNPFPQRNNDTPNKILPKTKCHLH